MTTKVFSGKGSPCQGANSFAPTGLPGMCIPERLQIGANTSYCASALRTTPARGAYPSVCPDAPIRYSGLQAEIREAIAFHSAGLLEYGALPRLALHQCSEHTRRHSSLRILSIRDLREHADNLVREAKSGRLFVVTKHGEPIFIAVPFDESLLCGGLAIRLATRLFDEETISLGQAARLAGMDVAEFMELLSCLKLPVARPGRGELEQEIETFS
ncbi:MULTISPECIES: UPF0175 family protein [unclassified Thiocapsa]|uniref:UPF0175 family protein n=1 Tax=unclassified Thiocapsa TaxID=2641286 RepID=UPI0035B4E696